MSDRHLRLRGGLTLHGGKLSTGFSAALGEKGDTGLTHTGLVSISLLNLG
jgi:hypothetical protein